MEDNFWESLRQGFTQLRVDCAIDPPLNPAGRLTAIWTAEREKNWRLNYHGGKDGNGVIRRFGWAAESAAARLGLNRTEDEAVSHWLDRIKTAAPESHIRRINTVKGIGQPEETYSVEILDICGLSADFCRKCQAEEIRSRADEKNVSESSGFERPVSGGTATVVYRIPELPSKHQDVFERTMAKAELEYAKRGEMFPHNLAFAESGLHLPLLIHNVFFEFCAQTRNALSDGYWTISQVRQAAETAWPAICDFYFVRERGAHSEEQKAIYRTSLWRTVADDPRWKQHLAELAVPANKASSSPVSDTRKPLVTEPSSDNPDPKRGVIRAPATRDEIESFAQDKFAVARDLLTERLPEKQRHALNQVRSTGNSGGYAPALIKLATERVREMILALADAYVEAFDTCGAPSDIEAERTLQKSAVEFAAGSISAITGQAHLDSLRLRLPDRPIPGLHSAVKIAVSSAIREGLLRLKEQRLKFKTSASPLLTSPGERATTDLHPPSGDRTDSQRSAISWTQAPTVKRKRGRPQEIPDERKLAAATLKSEGGTNKQIAALIYDTKHPSDQQRRNVPGILRHHRQKLERLNAGPATSKAVRKPNKHKG